MLARVTSGQSGIVEYLKNGVKSDRELSRDELDQRVNIDGNINITDSLINEMNSDGRKKNYLHITLSFGERDLKEETIIEAYQDYKKSLMSAYSDEEFNVYAEIHYPKIKSYQDKKTGEVIERFPHIHMVIPQKNLVSNKNLDPFGLYNSNIKYHDAIQETVNRNHKLESPYDNQRKYRLSDDSEFISRYKGDAFKGSNSEFKNEIFDLINTKNIRSMDEFKKALGKYGEVTTGKAGATDEYLKVKLTGKTKNIRLKENAFKPLYINHRELHREKPSDKEINKNINEWIDTRSHEMKHIQSASPKVRKEFQSLTKEQQKEYLNDRRNDFARRYNTRGATGTSGNDIQSTRRAANRELGITRNGGRGFTQTTNGLPSLPQRGLVRTSDQRLDTTQSVLSSDEHNNMESRGTSGNNQLRRAINRSRRSGGRRLKNEDISSFSEQLLLKYQSKSSPQSLEHFREIRKNLDPNRVLDHFAKTHGLIKSNYKTFNAKDGSPRIRIGNRAYNVSDFSTQHMHQDWQETKKVLTTLYKNQLKVEHKKIDLSVIGLHRFNQLNGGLPQKTIFKNAKPIITKKEKYAVNSIVFSSGYVTQRHNKQSLRSKLNSSVQILKHLQRQERYGEKKMSIFTKEENTISSSKIDLKSATEFFRKQQEMVKQFSMKMGDLIAVKDYEKGKVEFNDKQTGKAVFKDVGSHIVMADKKPSVEHVALAMTFAAEKFGKVEINGTKEFKKQVIEVAVAKDLNVIFADKKMQAQFIKDKEALKEAQSNEQTQTPEKIDKTKNSIVNADKDTQAINPNENSKNTSEQLKSAQRAQAQAQIQKEQVQRERTQAKENVKAEPILLVKHGEAPYKNIKGNEQSYFVETSDGKTQWGVGLKEAFEKSNAQVGDEVAVNRMGSKDVQITIPVKDKNDKVIGKETKTVARVEWDISTLQKATAEKTQPLLEKVKEKAQEIIDPNKAEEKRKEEDRKPLTVTYEWDEKDRKMEVKVNGKPPQNIPVEVMTNIKNNDKFLKSYSIENIMTGKLDLSKSNAQPVSKTFNMNGIPLVNVDKQQAPKQTQ